jgi:hypothetical protein
MNNVEEAHLRSRNVLRYKDKASKLFSTELGAGVLALIISFLALNTSRDLEDVRHAL